MQGHVRSGNGGDHREFVMASGEMSDAEFCVIQSTFLAHLDRSLKPGGFAMACMGWLNDGVQNLCQWISGSRPDANFFVHGHEEEVIAVGSIEDGLLPLNQPAVCLGNITGYIEYEFEEDEALGETAAAAFFRACFLRQTCSTQIKTLSMGRELHLIDPQKVACYQDQMAQSEHYNDNGKTEWPGLIRMLDKRGADYTT